MLIINADDYGLNPPNTRHVFTALKNGLITSATAMAFQSESELAAEMAAEHDLTAIGLHLNFSYPFVRSTVDGSLYERQQQIIGRLTSSRWGKFIYHPDIRQAMEYSFRAQWDEFLRLYGRAPTHVDGHQYYHLCANFLFSGLLPRGSKMRPNTNVIQGSGIRRAYKLLFNRWLARKYRTVGRLYDLDLEKSPDQVLDVLRLGISAAAGRDVELMVHVHRPVHIELLSAPAFRQALENVKLGSYVDL